MKKSAFRPMLIPIFFLFYSLGLMGCSAINPFGASSGLPCPIPTEAMGKPGDDSVSFTFENEFCATICTLNIAPGDCDDWGFDWLGYHNLHSGDSIILEVPPGKYDILIEICTQDYYIWEGLDLTYDNFATFSDPNVETSSSCASSLTVVNQSPAPICYMWIASPTSESFGLNWLADEQIDSGESYTFVVPAGAYDIKAEDCDFNILRLEIDAHISGHQSWSVP